MAGCTFHIRYWRCGNNSFATLTEMINKWFKSALSLSVLVGRFLNVMWKQRLVCDGSLSVILQRHLYYLIYRKHISGFGCVTMGCSVVLCVVVILRYTNHSPCLSALRCMRCSAVTGMSPHAFDDTGSNTACGLHSTCYK